MNAGQSVLSSPRFTRILFWTGLLALVAGVVVLIIKLVPDHSARNINATKPAKPLPKVHYINIKKYSQVDPLAKQAIDKFVLTAVARKNVGDSWTYIAPSLRKGYTLAQWKTGTIPVVPFPVYRYDTTTHHVVYATRTGLLIELGISPTPQSHLHPTVFRIGLVKVGDGAHARWLVNYWMPQYAPPVPEN